MSATIRSNKLLLKPLVTSGPVPPSLRDRPSLLSALRNDKQTSPSPSASLTRVNSREQSASEVQRTLLKGSAVNAAPPSPSLPSPRSKLQQWFDVAEDASLKQIKPTFQRGHRRHNTPVSLSFNQARQAKNNASTATHSPSAAQAPPRMSHFRRPSISLAFVSPFQHPHPTLSMESA